MLPIILLPVRNKTDPDFVALIYYRYQRLMYKIAGKYTSSPDEQEEIFQIASVRLLNCTDILKELTESQRQSYIGKLTQNTALNYIKHESVVSKHTAPLEADELHDYRLSLSPEDIILRKEKWEMILSALRNLSLTDQLVLIGKLWLEMSDKEMAAELGCKPQSVSMKLTRAKRRAMREIMRIDDDE